MMTHLSVWSGQGGGSSDARSRGAAEDKLELHLQGPRCQGHGHSAAPRPWAVYPSDACRKSGAAAAARGRAAPGPGAGPPGAAG